MKLFVKNQLLLLVFLLSMGSACHQRTAGSKTAVYTQKAPHPDGTGKVYMGREIAHVMSDAGGAWLERSERQQEEDVDAALTLMPLGPASVAADIGAGTGYYTFRMARLVPLGRVYAVEVQPGFVQILQQKKNALNLSNVEVVQGTAQSPNLPDASIDLAIMVDVYHELAYPHEMLQALHKAIKPSGRLLLLEYRAEDRAVPIKELHKMSVVQVNKELNANGFVLDKKQDFLPMQHFLLYRKQGTGTQ